MFTCTQQRWPHLLLQAESRCKAVDKQLIDNSKKFAKEISSLKMQVMERDAALANAGASLPFAGQEAGPRPSSRPPPAVHEKSGAVRRRTPELAPLY